MTSFTLKLDDKKLAAIARAEIISTPKGQPAYTLPAPGEYHTISDKGTRLKMRVYGRNDGGVTVKPFVRRNKKIKSLGAPYPSPKLPNYHTCEAVADATYRGLAPEGREIVLDIDQGGKLSVEKVFEMWKKLEAPPAKRLTNYELGIDKLTNKEKAFPESDVNVRWLKTVVARITKEHSLHYAHHAYNGLKVSLDWIREHRDAPPLPTNAKPPQAEGRTVCLVDERFNEGMHIILRELMKWCSANETLDTIALTSGEYKKNPQWRKQRTTGNAILFMLLTGARVGETRFLKWSEVDFQNNVVHLLATTTKTRHHLTIPMTPQLRHLLERQQELQNIEGREYIYVFQGGKKTPEPMTPTGVGKKFFPKVTNELKAQGLLRRDLRENPYREDGYFGFTAHQCRYLFKHIAQNIDVPRPANNALTNHLSKSPSEASEGYMGGTVSWLRPYCEQIANEIERLSRTDLRATLELTTPQT